ncbi:MAG TPA: DUF885 domain-containing protein [Thermoanaerobaculia bacterium]
MRVVFAYILLALAMPIAAQQKLHKVADDYYEWSKVNYPVFASDQGDHRFDERMTDYSAPAIAKRRAHVNDLLAKVNAMNIAKWPKDETIDWILFRSQLQGADFGARVLQSEESDPQTYVGTASNAIFSLLKKKYDTPQKRAMAAAARFRAMPQLYEQGKQNLTKPVKLYSQLAIDSARSIDPLFIDSMEPLARSLTPEQRKEYTAARDEAIRSTHAFAHWLQKRLPKMQDWKAMGTEHYDFMLHHLLLLPMDARDVAHLGEVELARYRALEAMLPDPSLADPDPKRAKSIPPDQQAFLAAYESREKEMIDFLREKNLITIPSYIGPFLIRQLPEAFKPTSPGGFMNPPGLFDKDNSGFYFIPTYDPNSRNFYIRAAIEDPRPILGHEGIPGHFLQISISNHVPDEIRREQNDTVFAEGWALYTEEMLMREGFYPENSAAQGQILRLSRYRAARIGVDVNLHTGKWTFEQGVKYFMEGGGLDREAAEGEAAGSASSPTQKISYITGKWQIMRLLGRYRDAKGSSFRLGQFHDDLIAHGTLPLSVIEWILLDDPASLEKATGLKLH